MGDSGGQNDYHNPLANIFGVRITKKHLLTSKSELLIIISTQRFTRINVADYAIVIDRSHGSRTIEYAHDTLFFDETDISKKHI